MMDKKKRFWALGCLGLAIIGILFLSSGLPGTTITTEWGMRLAVDEAGRGAAASGESLLDRIPDISGQLLRIVFMLTIIIVPTALFFAMFSPEVRRALFEELKRALPVLIWMITLLYLLRRLQLNRNATSSAPRSSVPIGAPDWITNPTTWVAFLISVILLMVVLGVGYFLWRKTRSSRFDLLAREAQTTINELQTGRDFKNAVIECYYRMCRILSEQRRMNRARSMTAREFAARLAMAGVGGKEAQRLTRLFEAARYGAERFSEVEEQEAITCLTAITNTAAEPGRSSIPGPPHLIIRSE
jgi:hypothetical protein